jgi:hypothetical protein
MVSQKVYTDALVDEQPPQFLALQALPSLLAGLALFLVVLLINLAIVWTPPERLVAPT